MLAFAGTWETRGLFAALIAAQIALNRAAARWEGLWRTAHLVAPMFLIPVAFLSLGHVMEEMGILRPVAEHPDFDPAVAYDPAATWWDLELKRLDTAIFGVYPPLWVRRLHTPWLTGFMQLGYLSYYFAPAIVAVPLLVRRKRREFRIVAATIIGCLFGSYLGYFCVPATGPRFEGTFEAWLPAEPGWFGAESMYRFLNGIESFRWDAFPSGHVAVGLIALWLAFRYERVVGWILLLPVVLLCLATIYLGYHYVVDVIVGAVWCAVSAWLFPRLVRAWER